MKVNKNKLAITISLILTIVTILGVVSIGQSPTRSHEDTLTSKFVTTAPILDGDGSDPVWADAEAMTTSNDVTMRSVYTNTTIYFLITWSDSTQSDTKHLWSFVEGEWDEDGDEDRLAIMWNMGNIEGFNSQGCQVVCHMELGGVEGRNVMKTNADGELGDMWHWKAARSDPVGYADDKWMDDKVASEDEWLEDAHDAAEAAHHGDSKDSGGYKDNRQDLDNGEDEIRVPKYYEPDATGDDARFITSDEVDNGEAKLITAVDLNGTLTYSGGTVPSTAKIPGYILEKPIGSRGDVDAGSNYAENKWTIEISRSLNTGSEDDIQFTSTASTAEYFFGVAVFDDSGGVSHSSTFAMDTDGDGVDDIDDEFPNDPDETEDSDDDGVGDNEDEFPDDDSETEDSDDDGVGDNADEFPNNASESKDLDGDGVGDNSDAFANDSAASVDNDKDGYPDEWNIGKKQSDSTSGLKLDAYPGDAEKWEKEDDDDDGGVPGFETAFVIIAVVVLLFIVNKNKKNLNE
jgi:hypothetical protein